MAAEVLRDDLLSLPGVERAEFDGDGISPSGIRVRLSPGMDPSVVGEEVRRVLAAHGLRSEVVGTPADAVPARIETTQVTLDDTEPVAIAAEPPAPYDEQEPEQGVSDGPSPPAQGLDTVAVVEGRDGTTVTVSGTGGTASVQAARASRPAVDQAVVSAVAGLAGLAAPPLIRSIDEREIGDSMVATVVIDAGGERLVGSAVVDGGWAYALGRAAWAAFWSRGAPGGIN